MINRGNQQLCSQQTDHQYQVIFLGSDDLMVDVVETQDFDVEEITACVKLGGSVFITSLSN